MGHTKAQEKALAKQRAAKNAAKKGGSSKGGGLPSFSFDAKKATKEYTKLANSIYDPQIQALQNQQLYNTKLAEQQKITTKSQFQDLLRSEIESINRRGAYFSGGAIANENKINTDQANALAGIDQATTQANLGLSSNLAQLNSEKSNYISSGVSGSQSSAYNQFQDSLNNYYKQQQLLNDAQNKSRGSIKKLQPLDAVAATFNNFNGDWEKTATYLADNGYDVSSGSVIDNELRRRNNLPPIPRVGSSSSYYTGNNQSEIDNLFPTY